MTWSFWSGVVSLVTLGVIVSVVGRALDLLTSPYDPDKCGRDEGTNEPIFVCDPDGILNSTQVSDLEGLIEEIRNETVSSCSTNETSQGYTIRATFLRHYNESIIPLSSDFEHKHRLRMSQYASLLQSSLTSGENCSDSVLIIASKENQMLETVVGSAANQVLTPDQLREINAEASTLFLQPDDVVSGVRHVIVACGNLLRDGQTPRSVKPPESRASDQQRNTITVAVVVGAVGGTLLVLGAIVARWWRGRDIAAAAEEDDDDVTTRTETDDKIDYKANNDERNKTSVA